MGRIQILVVSIFVFVACKGNPQEQRKENVSFAGQPLAEWTAKDSLLFEQFPDRLHGSKEWAKFFIGTPYKAATLEIGDDFRTLLNFSAFDCTTFVENVVALVWADELTRTSFVEVLTRLRYRLGKPQGYSSRLHYFSEWIIDNESKGFIVDCTQNLGGVIVKKPINFMTKHRELYPALEDTNSYKRLQQIEEKRSNSKRYVIPKDKIAQCINEIKEGDIIAFATNIEGLDFVHLGFAIFEEQTGNVHLLHASSKQGAVVISKEPLVEYAKNRSDVSGIVVLRIQNKEE